MKLRSIVLAGLLSTAALMTTGCLEDSVDDIINALDIQAGRVVLFNDTDAVAYIMVNGESNTVSLKNILGNTTSVVTEDDHTISISYSGSANIPSIQNNGTTYVYAAATNCLNGYVLDTVGTEKLRVMNLSGTDIANDDLNISRNGVKIDLPSAAGNCAVTATYTGDTDGDWAVQYKGVDVFGTGAYPSSNADVKVEIVIYDTSSGTEAGGIALITDISL